MAPPAGDWVLLRASPAGAETDINLLELYTAIRARWSWVGAGVLLGSLVAVTYLMLAVPLYESHVTIQIGQIHEFGPIEDVETLTAKLMEQYGRPPAGRGGPGLYLKQAGRSGRQNNLLTLTATGRSPEQARNFAEQVGGGLVQRHEQVYRQVIDPLRRELAAVDAQMEHLRRQAGEFDHLVSRLKSMQPVQASVAAIERNRIYVQMSELERDRILLQQTIGEPYSRPTQVVVPAELPGTQASPRGAVVMVIGIGAGMALGLFAVFVGARFGGRTR